MNKLRNLRIVALVEGISYLLLLGVAMPLKYLFHKPLAVKIVGSAHGFLFVLLCLLLGIALLKSHLTFKRAALVFLASLLPFGPMLIDRRMRSWEQEIAVPRP